MQSARLCCNKPNEIVKDKVIAQFDASGLLLSDWRYLKQNVDHLLILKIHDLCANVNPQFLRMSIKHNPIYCMCKRI